MDLDWYNLCENPSYLKNIIYGDTDSLFIFVDETTTDVRKMVKIARLISLDVNKKIIDFTSNYILPTLGYDGKYNQTSFKEEMVMDACIFLDIKKTYAYRLLAKEAVVDENDNLIKGRIFETPKIVPTSNLGIKTNVLKITNELLGELLEIALNSKFKASERLKKASLVIKNIEDKFIKMAEEFELLEVALPCKWNKTNNFIYGMKLYNKIIENKFDYGSTGLFFYCKFKNISKIKDLNLNIDKLENLNGIAIPYEYDKEILKQTLKKYDIELDIEKQIEANVKTKTVMRLLELFEEIAIKEAKNGN